MSYVASMTTLRRRAVAHSWLLRYATPAPIPHGWQERAACRAVDPNVFFATKTRTQDAEAAAMCAACPVRLDCLHDAYLSEVGENTHHIFGVRGGLSATARREFLRSHPEHRSKGQP